MRTVQPLLATKLSVPPYRATTVSRPRLMAQLDLALEHALTLLLASTGFGKTTALSSWWHYRQTQPEPDSGSSSLAWLSLDEADSDPSRFLAYLIGAVQQADSQLGQAAWQHLQQSGDSEAETVLTLLINELHQRSTPLILILDDYHLIDTPTVHELLTFLLQNQPPPLHLILASRVEPPLPLARLRMRGHLLQLDTADLRFNLTETTTFFNQTMDSQLSSDAIITLENRTEGWVAGLQLAALALQGQEERMEQVVASFGGNHRYVVDYLAAELLNRQSPEVQQFLLATSVLERLTAPLCDFLLADKGTSPLLATSESSSERRRPSSQAMLDYLEQANLFIIPLDDERQWYRYHALFADFLMHRLRQQSPDQLLTLSRRAAEWCEQHGLMTEALTHALEAADVERAVRLVKQLALRLFSRSEIATITSWLNALSDEIKASRTRLRLFQAWSLLVTGQLERVEERLQASLNALDDSRTSPTSMFARLLHALPFGAASNQEQLASVQGEVSAIRGTIAYLKRDTPAAIEQYQQAMTQLPADNTFLRGAVALNLGLAYGVVGDLKKSQRGFQQAYDLNQAAKNRYIASIALWHLAELYLLRGQRHRAAELYQQIAALEPHASAESTLPELEQLSFSADDSLRPDLSGVYVGQGALLYEENKLAEAEQALTTGLVLAKHGTDSVLIEGYRLLAYLKRAQGDWAAAFDLLHEISRLIQREKIAPYWEQQVKMGQAQLWLWQGNLDAVQHWATERQLSLSVAKTMAASNQLHVKEREFLVLARWLIAQKEAASLAEAVALLTLLNSMADQGGRTGQVIEILSLQALALHAQGESGRALNALNRALSLAEPEGYLRLFIDVGGRLATLLRQITPRQATANYAGRLLTAFGPDTTDDSIEPLLEPLSERELEILQLIAAGLSNQKIGDQLFLTTGTIKWHISNIYSKLNVRKRTQAVARARDLRLL